MKDRNEIVIRGRLTFDAEFLPSPPRTKFTVATNIPYIRSDGELDRDTTFHQVTVWKDNLSYLKRGDVVQVTGKVNITEGKQGDGREFYGVIASEVLQIVVQKVDTDSFVR